MKKHINVAKAWKVWGLGLLLSIIGTINVTWQMLVPSYFFSFQSLIIGLVLLIAGFSLIVVNWAVFNVRTSQLQIDTQEDIRDHIGNVCPNCGQRQPEGSKFCNNCGNTLK